MVLVRFLRTPSVCLILLILDLALLGGLFESVHAGDYHIGTENLYCSDCHTMHYSQDDSIPATWGTEGPYGQLLKNLTNEMCLMCHDGTDPSAPSVMGANEYVPSAGTFKTTLPGRQHSLGSIDPPPGYSGSWGNDPLTCVSCHDPHGNAYYRNLRTDPGGLPNRTVTYETGEPYGGEAAIQQLVITPLTEHYTVENIRHRQSETGTHYGLSAWCAGCHTDFYGVGGSANMGGSPTGDTTTSDMDTWIRHPTLGITMSEGVTNEHIDGDAENGLGYWWSSQILSRIPYISPSGETGTKYLSDNEPGCGSCHKAHGSDQLFCLIFDDPETSDPEDGVNMVGTCQACHLRGGGHYETSPHGDPNTGILRRTRWAAGECKHCHDQHQGNPYNLFDLNTNNLCYTSGCHDFTPTGGYSGYPAQEEDRAPATSAYPGYFEYFSGGVRATGLNNRVRWPGMEVFEDSNTYSYGPPQRFISPHRNDPDMPRRDSDGNGLCVNCHSPHGTENPFDMLNDTYLGTKDSWLNDVPENYALCFGCHGPDGPSGMDDETTRIADYYDDAVNPNTAGHKIRKSTKSASYWPNHIRAGDKLACSNCHNPHGSRGYGNNGQPNVKLLSDQRPQWNGLVDTVTSASKCRTFCFGCHIPSDDPNCSLYSSGCPEVDGIQMVPIPALPGAQSSHKANGSTHCGNCHGRNYDATTSASPAFNVHNPKASPQHGGMEELKPLALPAPTGFIATGGKRVVELVWDRYPDEGIRGYHLYRSKTPGGPYTLLASEPDCITRYMDSDIRPEQNYYYVLTMEDMSGNQSPYSREASATPLSLTPGQLRTLEEIQGLSAAVKDDRVCLSWEECTDELVAGYQLYRRMEGDEHNPVLLTPEAPLRWPVYEDMDVHKGTVYLYSVVAVDGMGNEARFPREIRVAYMKLFISSVSLSQGETPLRGGQEMVVTVTGSSGADAYFTIKGITSRIPLEEVGDSGTYIGNYLVPPDIEEAEVPIICYLRDPGGEKTSMDSPALLKIDNLPPPPPQGLETALDANGDVNLHWDTDEAKRKETSGYRIYRDTGLAEYGQITITLSGDDHEYTDRTTAPGMRYRYAIASVDEAGNESAPSNQVVVEVPADTSGPSIMGMRFIEGMGVWRPGESISMLLIGEPGCTARFSIGNRIRDVGMKESFEGGKYEGGYVFRDGDEGYQMAILGTLTDASGNISTFEPELRVSVVRGEGDEGPEIYEMTENSFQAGGNEGLVAGDVLRIRVRGTPGCTGVFHLAAYSDDERRIVVDWSGFRESEYPDCSGYAVYRGTHPPSVSDENEPLTRLGLGEKQFLLPDGIRLDPDAFIYVAAVDRQDHPRVIATPKWDIPLVPRPDEPDIYEGEYIIQPGDRLIQGHLCASLTSATGRHSIPSQSAYAITIDSGSRIDIRPQPAEINADNTSRSRVRIILSDARGRPVTGREIGLSMFTTSEYSGLIGLGTLNSNEAGSLVAPPSGTGRGREEYPYTTDDFGGMEVDYEAGFAAKTVIFRVRDRITGDTGLGFCTSYIETQAQVEQYIPALRLKQGVYAISVTASPDWLTADGVSTSRITARITRRDGAPVKDHRVVFAISMGDGRLVRQEGITDEGGTTEVTYIAGIRIGTVEIRAIDTTAHIEGNTYIIQKSDAPAVCLLTAEPGRIPADGTSRCKLRIKVTDIHGNPSRGAGISLRVERGGGKIVEIDDITDFMGEATAIYQSGNDPGVALFTLKVSSKIPTREELEEIKWAR